MEAGLIYKELGAGYLSRRPCRAIAPKAEGTKAEACKLLTEPFKERGK
jgi:hypothetical protein